MTKGPGAAAPQTSGLALNLMLGAAVLVGLSFAVHAQGDDRVAGTAAVSVAPRPWSSLTVLQQRILATLETDWSQMAGGRQQKWLELSDRMMLMPAAERYRVQQRMAEWAHLSPAQRSQARMQFLEAKQLPQPQLRDKWQEYQALTEEQRQELAAQALRASTAPAAAAAAAARRATQTAATNPVAGAAGAGKQNLVVAQSLSPTRQVSGTAVQAKPGATTRPLTAPVAPPPHNQPGLPKIAATAGFVDPTTLLPMRGPQGAAVPATLAASAALKSP